MSTNEIAEEGLHKQRRRLITRTALTGVLAKSAMFLPTILIAWVAVPHLGSERYGVLMTVLSLLGFLGIADLGVGGTLITALSRESGTGNNAKIRQLQANGIVITFCMAGCILLLAGLFYYLGIGSQIFKSSSTLIQAEGTSAICSFFFLFALTLPLTLISKIQLGLQHGYIANYWQAVSAILNFAGAALVTLSGGGVPLIIIGIMSGTVICGLLNCFLYYKKFPIFKPSIDELRISELKKLLIESRFYLSLQVIFTISYTADTLMVARFLGTEQASVYSLCERIFSIVAVAISVVTGPLWVAYGEAIGRADFKWVNDALKLSTIRIFCAGTLLSLLLLFTLDFLVGTLSRGHISIPISLAISMAGWRIVESVGGAISVFMFATKANRIVMWTGIVTAVVSVFLKILFISEIGFIAIPLVSAMCFFLFSLVPCYVYIRRVLKSQLLV